ncbi:aconitase X swivel domain-containing protein [Chloroflexota bacterium]
MGSITLKAKGAIEGIAEGEALVSPGMICFCFDVDIGSGIIHDPRSSVMGQSLAGKILVFPMSRGSTASPYGLYLLYRAGRAPKAIISVESDPMSVTGAIISHIPMVYNLDQNPIDVIETGDYVQVDGNKGEVVVTKKRQTFSSLSR